MLRQLYLNGMRERFGLNPDYSWAVENFDAMSKAIPGFHQIYAGREPQKFIIRQITRTQIKLEIEPGKYEWHSREHYFIVPGRADEDANNRAFSE